MRPDEFCAKHPRISMITVAYSAQDNTTSVVALTPTEDYKMVDIVPETSMDDMMRADFEDVKAYINETFNSDGFEVDHQGIIDHYQERDFMDRTEI